MAVPVGQVHRWRTGQAGSLHKAEVASDEQISWAAAEHTIPDLACIVPVGYSVGLWIHGKKSVYTVMRVGTAVLG